MIEAIIIREIDAGLNCEKCLGPASATVEYKATGGPRRHRRCPKHVESLISHLWANTGHWQSRQVLA